jgi:hypothetical protein
LKRSLFATILIILMTLSSWIVPTSRIPVTLADAATPLSSLQLLSATGVTVISPGTGAKNNGHPINQGLQVQGSATIDLNGHYTQLAGTLYEDDVDQAAGETFFIKDTSDPTYTRPLYGYKTIIKQEIVHFAINVRGVDSIQIGTIACQNCSPTFDLVADLYTGGTPPTSYPVPLGKLQLLQNTDVTIIPVGNLATNNGHPINQGLQVQGSATIDLNGHYSQLTGTLYEDDMDQAAGETFFIKDTSDPTYTRPLYGYKTTIKQEIVHFAINVRGVDSIQIGAIPCQNCSPTFDLVAALYTGGTPPASYPIPLEQLHLLQNTDVTIIPVGNLATNNGRPINRGLQVQGSATINLNGHYTQLAGMLYEDDVDLSSGETFFIKDTTTSTARTLYTHTAAAKQEVVHFAISVQGVKSIQIGAIPCQNCSPTFDLAANLYTSTPSQRSRTALQLTAPGSNASVTGNAVHYSWTPVTGAATYYLHVYLVRAASGASIAPNATMNIAWQGSATQYTLDATHLVKGEYSWNVAAVDKTGALIQPGWTAERVFTLS